MSRVKHNETKHFSATLSITKIAELRRTEPKSPR